MSTECVVRLVFVAFIVSLLIGQGRPAGAQDHRSEPRIVRIEVVCREPFDEEGVRNLLPFAVGDVYRAETLEEARRILLLRDIFESVVVDSKEVSAGTVIKLRLTRLPLVNRVRFSGNDALDDEELRRVSRLRAGYPLSAEAREYATDRVRERYEAAGFPNVIVESESRVVAAGEVDIFFHIDEGAPLLISSVEFKGVTERLLVDLKDAVELEVGDRYSKAGGDDAVKAAVMELRDHRYYEARVEARWNQLSPSTGVLVFEVATGPEFSLEFRGNQHLSDDDLVEPMDLRQRPIITDGTWRQLARRAVRTYQEEGFHQAEVTLRTIEHHRGPSLRKVVAYDIDEGVRFRVRQIEFENNDSMPASELRAVMQTRPPSWFPWHRGVLVDDTLDQDLEQLVGLYRKHGFLSARLLPPAIEHDAVAGAITVRLEIEEGPQVIISAVEITGMEVLRKPLPELRTEAGRPLDDDGIESDRRTLIATLMSAGYAEAEVSVDVEIKGEEPHGRVAKVRFAAKPAKMVRIGRIVVQNNFDTRSKVIERELPFRTGDILDSDRLLSGQGKIYQLGLFRSVTVRTAEESTQPGVRDVVVRVAEKPPGSFQWGLGFNTRDGFRGVGQVGYQNLRGLGDSISLRGQLDLEVGDVSPSQYLADVSYRQPHVLETLWSGSLKFVAQRSERDIDDFKLQRFALIPGLERPLGEGLIAGLAVQIDQTEVFDLASEIANEVPPGCDDCRRLFDDEGDFVSVSLDPFLVRNALDDEFRPKSGTFESLRLRFAPGAVGTDVPIVKLLGQHSQYVPLGPYLTFIYALRFGWARTLQGREQVPIQERFFLGGRTTVRGFSENAVGPETRQPAEEEEGEEMEEPEGKTPPLGGDVSVIVNGELHFPLIYGLRGALFFDGGGLYLQTYDAEGEGFREAAGVGLRYMTPVGPLSLDYGFKLDRRGGESLGEIHFSVGRVF
jgi:outer membrane protein assembly complex protein YaeT